MARELAVIAPRGVSKAFDPETLLAEWQADMQARVDAGERAATTAATYARGVKHFLAWVQGQADLGGIGPQAIRAYKAALRAEGRTPAGVNVFYAGVKDFFKWAVAERGLAYDPTATVEGASRRGTSRRHKREALSDTEVLRVLQQPDKASPQGKRDRAMLYLMAFTGARSVEAQRARIGDLHSNGHLKLFVQGKGRSEADEPLYLVNSDLVDAVYTWLAVHPKGRDLAAPLFCGLGNRNHGGPLSMRAIRDIIKGYYKAAGIVDPRKTTHSLRHSLVTNLIKHGAAPTQIMTVTRHKSLDTLLNYAKEIDRDTDPVEGLVDYGTLGK